MEVEMRFSYAPLPVNPATEIVDTIALAEELGFYGAYFPDETYHKDAWLIAAVAARQTNRIRLSPCATHVILKEPTILAQTIATLDELSDGRAEAVFGIGNIAMLAAVRPGLEVQRLDTTPARGTSRAPDDARRGQHRLRGRVLPLLGPVHGGAAGAGARAAEDRRHPGPEIVRAGRRDRRRHAPGVRVLERDDRLRNAARAGGCRTSRARR